MTGRLTPGLLRNLSEKWETRLTHQMPLGLGCEWIHLQGGLGE